MEAKDLYNTKFYVVDLETQTVDTERHFDTYYAAIDDARVRLVHKRYTAFTGSHIKKHTRTWSVGG